MQANTEKAQKALVTLVERYQPRAEALGWRITAELLAPGREDSFGGAIEGSWRIRADIDAQGVAWGPRKRLLEAAVEGLEAHIRRDGRIAVSIETTMAKALASLEATILAVVTAAEALMDAHRARLATAIAQDQRALDTI